MCKAPASGGSRGQGSVVAALRLAEDQEQGNTDGSNGYREDGNAGDLADNDAAAKQQGVDGVLTRIH